MTKSRRLFLIFPVLPVLLFAALQFQIINFHEEDTVDWRFRLRGARQADPAITVIVVDDQSLKNFGQWPWPRSIHAAFLSLLINYEPKSVFFDMLFTESSTKAEEDALFAEAVKKSGNVILPFFYRSTAPFKAEFPIPSLMSSIQNTAFVNAVQDLDGHIRKINAYIKTEEGIYYSPAFLLAAAFQNKENPVENIPLDSENSMWINFPGPLKSFRVASYNEVISLGESEEDQARLRDLFYNRLVLVGHMATGTTDLKSTAFSIATPGVIAHASALDTLLSKKYIRRLPWYFNFLILLTMTVTAGFVFRKLSVKKSFIALCLFSAVYFSLNFLVFIFGGLILPLPVVLTALILTFIISLFIQYAEIYLQKEMSARELAMAARIQEQFLPQEKPQFPQLDVAYETRFLKEVGGDLYDWFDLGDGRFAFCVGDVSGKGMPAAIYMAKTLSDLRSIDKKTRTAGAVCTELNRILTANPAAGMFLTLFYGILDPGRKCLQFSSAGHEPAIVYRKKNKNSELLEGAQGLPLGMFEADYENGEVFLEEGDSLLLYTDGVKELRNKKREEFGAERLKVSMNSAGEKDLSASEHLKTILQEMQKHQQSISAHDDCTLFCLQFKTE